MGCHSSRRLSFHELFASGLHPGFWPVMSVTTAVDIAKVFLSYTNFKVLTQIQRAELTQNMVLSSYKHSKQNSTDNNTIGSYIVKIMPEKVIINHSIN